MATEGTAIKNAVITIKVFGVGGGGNNVLQRIAESNFLDIELVAVNTDAKQLARTNSEKIKCIQIGSSLTKGRGTGGSQEIGAKAAKDDEETLKALLKGADLIFVTAGMGGGTGTGAVPVIARLAKEMGILTVGVVTIPFSFEGARKKRIAEAGIAELRNYIDALIAVQNDNLMKLPNKNKMSLVEAFHEADEVLKQAIRCISELILTIGVVNVDFADVTTVLRQSANSDSLLGIGRSSTSAVDAVKEAVKSPLIDRPLKGAGGIILNITGDDKLSLYDVNEAVGGIFDQASDDSNIILGTVIDDKMNGMIQATIIATDFKDGTEEHTAPVQPVQSHKSPEPETKSEGSLEPPSFMRKTDLQGGSLNSGFAIPAFRLAKE